MHYEASPDVAEWDERFTLYTTDPNVLLGRAPIQQACYIASNVTLK